jgi:hypothetical protein
VVGVSNKLQEGRGGLVVLTFVLVHPYPFSLCFLCSPAPI